MKIRTKIMGGLFLAFLLSVVFAIYSFHAISRVMDYHARLETVIVANNRATEMVQAHHVWLYRITESFLFDTPFTEELDPSECIWGQWRHSDDIFSMDDPILTQLIYAVDYPHSRMHLGGAFALSLRDEGLYDRALWYLQNVVIPYANRSVTAVIELSDRYYELWRETRARVDRVGEEIILSAIMICVVGFAAFVLLSILIPKSIFRPIKKLVTFVSAAAEGDETAYIDKSDISDDEIGVIVLQIQNMLREVITAQELNHIVIETSPYVVGVWRGDRPIHVSTRAKELFGVDDPMEVAERLFDFSPPLQPCGTPSPEKARYYEEVAYREGYVRFDWMHIAPNGEPMPAEVTYQCFTYDGEKMLVSYTRDLREIRAAEERLHTVNEAAKVLLTSAEEDTLTTLVKGMEVMGNALDVDRAHIWHYTEVDGELCFVLQYEWLSELAKQKRGYPEGFIYHRSNDSAWFDNTILQGKNVNSPVSELPPAIKSYYAGFDVVSTAIFPMILDGDIIGFFEVQDCGTSRIFTHDEMDIMGSIGLMCTSAYNKMEMSLRTREADTRTRLMFNAAPIIVQYWDRRYNLIDCNESTLTFYGVSNKELYIHMFRSLVPGEQPDGTASMDAWDAFLEETFQKGTADTEFLETTTSGQPAFFEVHALRSTLDNEDVVITYSTDVTQVRAAVEKEKKAMAEMHRIDVAEESNRAKSAFLARMSHEIRTPITAVMGLAEIELQAAGLSPRVEESFAKIHSSATQLLAIVNDVLDLSKIEAGKMELLPEEYEVADMIVDATHMHVAFSGSKDIKFNLFIDENIPAILVGDVMRIGQIMNNILSNAFKYTESGFVELSLDFQAEHLVIQIKDTGYGMTEEQLQDLSNEYTRYHERDTQKVGGTGLGMPIVFSLVQAMDAEINVTSRIGVGTTVIVRIPQKTVGEQVLGKELAQSLQQFDKLPQIAKKRFNFEPESMPYGKVLVVDDVDANLYVAKGLLAFYDLQIETCTSGFDAIKQVESGKIYDIIFMDHMMPGMNGQEAMLRLRELGYDRPIVVLTANAMIGQAEEFIRNGFDGFVSKPIQTRRLNDMLIKHIRDNQPQEVLDAAKAARIARPPSDSDAEGDIYSFQRKPALLAKLKEHFESNHSTTYSEICQAINVGDFEVAHRLAHTLKGSAGLILEDRLAVAAEDVEKLLLKEKIPTSEQLQTLERETNRVLASITATKPPPPPKEDYLSTAESLPLLDSVEQLLITRNTAAIKMTPELSKIKDSEALCQQIEGFNFKAALETLATLRASLTN